LLVATQRNPYAKCAYAVMNISAFYDVPRFGLFFMSVAIPGHPADENTLVGKLCLILTQHKAVRQGTRDSWNWHM